MSTFQAKDSQVLGRQLEAQEVIVTGNLVSGKTDAPGIVAVDTTSLTATVITLTVNEEIEKCFFAEVRNRATGAIVATAAAPSLAQAKKISITVDATGITDAAVRIVYKVKE